MGIVEQYLLQLNTEKRRWRHAIAILTCLSLIVAVATVWNLRMTGVTIANDAGCGIAEHQHTPSCMQEDVLICQEQEHIHSVSCYSDPNADVETLLDWQNMFRDYPYTGQLPQDLVNIAKTQVGYRESQRNFELGRDGLRRGYSRYGAWYGAPYQDWSATFISFCLHFAGADPAEYPMNAGAASMAALWKDKGKYAEAGQYTPAAGDLVFFDNNTAGIVTQVQNATIQVICGDLEDAVGSCSLLLTDKTIAGWGMVSPSLPEPELDPLDISKGPVFIITEDPKPRQQTQTYSLRATRAIIDLLPYLEANGGGYFFTLLDNNNVELPKNEQGQYIAQANASYKLTISFTSPNGFTPGTYQYQVPNGLMVDGGEGEFVLTDGTHVGSWTVTDTGLITLAFNENMNNHSNITISATMGIHFPDQNDPIDFDGKITVTVEKPPQQQDPTHLSKWGQQGVAANGQDPSKLYWNVQITGNRDSQIPGNILSDEILTGEWSKDHRYTESDMAGGLSFGVSEPDPVTGEFKDWHAWQVPAEDPHLIWTETGWSYKMPETAICQWCGEVVLGNENWVYTVNYTSTPYTSSTAGTYGYENQASIDGQYAYAWTDFTHGEAHGEVVKTGAFVSDASGGNFLWEFQAMVPGRKEGQKADYHWYIMDYMYLISPDNNLAGYMENDAHLATVTATVNDTTLPVPNIRDATEKDLFAWENAWTANHNGVNYGREFNLLCRCRCNADNCRFWNGKCENYWFDRGDGVWITNGFCQCWTVEENVTFTFVYATEALSVTESYGGIGYKLQNLAELHYKPDAVQGTVVDSDNAMVPIPGVFKKELTQDFNGYTAHYRITVNEAKAVLTDGSPLTIFDEMTDTLAYISGSLVIAAEDANGNRTILRQDTHYTVRYDGSPGQTDDAGNKIHLLEIVILQPQPVMYILDYDTTLIMPEQVTGGVKYSNSATITLWGQEVKNDTVEKVHADINIAARSYKLEMTKTCAQTKKPLPGATFGLYTAHGGLVTTGVTDAAGKIPFQTNVVQGIILREHVLYYLQELRAPPAYQLDDTKYWFCFCDNRGDICIHCENLLTSLESDATRIPLEQLGKFHIVNEPISCELPATGGVGTPIYILCGLALTVGPLVYGFSLRRRYERRSKH